jgi:hypothetical protein
VFIFAPNGVMYVALTSENTVKRLRHGGFLGCAMSNARYMRGVARYALRRNNVVIRTSSYDHFLLDLDHHGFLRLGIVDL